MARVLNCLIWGLLCLSLTSCGQKPAPETPRIPSPPPSKPKEKPLPSLPSVPKRIPHPPAPSFHKVGLLLPLSGPHENLGKDMLQAAEMALFESGTSSVMLLPQDTAQGAYQAAQRVLDQGAELLLGPIFATEVEAVKPLLHTRNVNLISFSTDHTVANQRTFILGFIPSQQIERVIHFAKERGVSKIAALTPDDHYGQLIDQTLKRLESHGEVQLLGITHYTRGDLLEGNPGNARVLEEVKSYRALGLEALVIPEGGENLGLLLGILRPLLPLKILGSGQWDTNETLSLAGFGLEGALFAAPLPQERQNFEIRFQKTFGAVPPRLATLAFDATALAASLADKGYSFQNLIYSEGFLGIEGLFRLTPMRLNERALVVFEVTSSGFKPLSPAQERF